jgi:hypothetical protein
MNLESLNIIEIFWIFLLILVSFILICLSVIIFKEEKRLMKFGEKTVAEVENYNEQKIIDNDRYSSRILVYKFYDLKQNLHEVKSKTNRNGKIGESCIVYYNIENPSEEYYLEKDYMRKYILLFFGLFFLTIGLLMLKQELN